MMKINTEYCFIRFFLLKIFIEEIIENKKNKYVYMHNIFMSQKMLCLLSYPSHVPFLCIDKNTSKFQIILYSGFFLPEILTMLGNHFHSSGNYFEASCKVRNKCTILAVTND